MFIEIEEKEKQLKFLAEDLQSKNSMLQSTETPTAKARWVLEYLNFQYITNDIKTNLFLQDFY